MAVEIVSTLLYAAQPLSSGAGAYDLTDLATAKDELGIPTLDSSRDPFLTRGISQISSAIATYCNRVFQVETVKDEAYPDRDAYPWQVPGGVAPLQLSRWPVLSTVTALVTTADAPTGSTSFTFASTTGVALGMPVHAPNPVYGGQALPGLAYDAVVTGLTATTASVATPTTADIPAGTTLNFGPRVSLQNAPGSWSDLVLGTDYLIDGARGWLVRLNQYTGYPSTWDPVQTNVRYQAGYSTIPLDLVAAALRMLTQRNDARGRDPYLKSQEQPGLGTQTFWVGGLPGTGGLFSEEIRGLIDPYRVPVAT